MKQKNKKAQVGITLTWFIAFVIIFFIMLIFLTFSSGLAGKKALPLIGGGYSDVKLIKSSNSLYNQRQLFSILETPVEGKTIKELIILKDKEKAEEEIKKILENSERDCYLFLLSYGSGGEIKIESGTQKYDAATRGPTAMVSLSDKASLNLLEGKYETELILNREKVNIFLYTEKC